MKVPFRQLERHLTERLAKVYLVAGDEPLLVDEALEKLRAAAMREGFTSRELHTADRSFKWVDLLAGADNLSLFATRKIVEIRLATQRFLLGAEFVETDWRLFCTLVRFDAVYYAHFKCNLRRIVDYPNLSGYLRDLYQTPGVADTVNLDHIKRHYYVTHTEINPTQIVPLGPVLDFDAPHDRARLAGSGG